MCVDWFCFVPCCFVVLCVCCCVLFGFVSVAIVCLVCFVCVVVGVGGVVYCFVLMLL